MQALLQHVVSTKGCPYQCSALGLPLKCTCCFNRWGSCRTGTWNLHRVILNWMLIKFTDVQWPRQTRHIQTCLHTLISHPTDQRVHLSTQGKFKVVSLSIYFSHSPVNFILMHVYVHTRTATYAYTPMDNCITQRFYIFSKIKIVPNSGPVSNFSSHSHQIRIVRKYCTQFYLVHTNKRHVCNCPQKTSCFYSISLRF